MSHDTQAPHPMHGPLRRIVGSVLTLLHTRVELIGIELAEEKERLLGALFAGLAAMLLAMMALITLTVLIAISFWDTYRWQSLMVMTLVYALGAIGCGWKVRSGLRQAPLIFRDTLAEFEKDRAIFKKPTP